MTLRAESKTDMQLWMRTLIRAAGHYGPDGKRTVEREAVEPTYVKMEDMVKARRTIRRCVQIWRRRRKNPRVEGYLVVSPLSGKKWQRYW